jgi:hypothetical protein
LAGSLSSQKVTGYARPVPSRFGSARSCSMTLRDGAPMLARETNRRWLIASIAILAIAADGRPA